MALGFILGVLFTFLFLIIPAILNSIPCEYENKYYYYEENYRDIKGSGKFNNEIWKNNDKNVI